MSQEDEILGLDFLRAALVILLSLQQELFPLEIILLKVMEKPLDISPLDLEHLLEHLQQPS